MRTIATSEGAANDALNAQAGGHPGFYQIPGVRATRGILEWALVQKIEQRGFIPEMFYSEHPHTEV